MLGAVPSQELIIAERFFDEGGGMQLVIHAPFGARINKAWGLALRKKFCRSFNFELQAAATDNGLNISLSEQHSFPLADVFRYLLPATVQQILEQAVLAAPLFGVRWRWAAGRALALLRFQGGKKVAPQIQRMRAEDLLGAVFPQALACQENIVGDIAIPDHPLVRETMKDVLTEALDVGWLEARPVRLGGGPDQMPGCGYAGAFGLLARDTERQSLRLSRRRAARGAQSARRGYAPRSPEALASELGRLDPAAIDEVRRDAWPDVRDADELHDALLTFVALPEVAPPEALPLLCVALRATIGRIASSMANAFR